MSQVKRVPVALARALGLYDDEDFRRRARVRGRRRRVDIPCWRHAIINFPHPLLQQGLVILDTPGLNAIGTEPELTLNLLPNAHAVLFVLAADAGVTKTDLEVWTARPRRRRSAAQKAARHRRPEQDRRPLGRARSRKPTSPPRSSARSTTSATLLGHPAGAGVSPCPRRRGCSPRSTATTRCSSEARLPALEDALSREAHPGEARHRRRGDAGRGARARGRRARAARRAADEHRRAARGAARAARQEPGRRRAHDGARAPRRRSSSSAACSASPRCAPCSRSRRTSCST